MSVAPLIPPDSSSAASASGKSTARPKRIRPPAHWKDAAPAPLAQKPATKPTLPAVTVRTTSEPKTVLSPLRFGALVFLGAVALNAMLLWLFPLPSLNTIRREAPAFSPAPTSEDSELPVWLRP